MGYCAVTDIQAEFKSLTFSTTSNVTTAAVTQFIAEATALINSFVGTRWVTPVTADADSLALMQLFCRTLVADRVRGIMANKQQTNTDANAQVKSDGYSVKDVMKSLNDIRSGLIQLSGATLLLEDAGFFSNNESINTQPRFNKNRRQW